MAIRRQPEIGFAELHLMQSGVEPVLCAPNIVHLGVAGLCNSSMSSAQLLVVR